MELVRLFFFNQMEWQHFEMRPFWTERQTLLGALHWGEKDSGSPCSQGPSHHRDCPHVLRTPCAPACSAGQCMAEDQPTVGGRWIWARALPALTAVWFDAFWFLWASPLFCCVGCVSTLGCHTDSGSHKLQLQAPCWHRVGTGCHSSLCLLSNCLIAVFIEHLLCAYPSASLAPVLWGLGFLPWPLPAWGRVQGDADNNPPIGVTPTCQALFSVSMWITSFNLPSSLSAILQAWKLSIGRVGNSCEAPRPDWLIMGGRGCW